MPSCSCGAPIAQAGTVCVRCRLDLDAAHRANQKIARQEGSL